jgi:hypothetical protein
MNTKETYGIKHKITGLYFVGFGQAYEVLWGTADKAWRDTKIAAEGQAALFICNDIRAQRKPVALS